VRAVQQPIKGIVNVRRWVPLLLVAAAACVQPQNVELPSLSPPGAPTLHVRISEGGQSFVRRIELEEYVHGAIVSEFAPSAAELFHAERMYEVQAIVSRTYAAANVARHQRDGFDLCDTTHCQLYRPSRLVVSRWTRAAANAVERTKGMILWHDTTPATAVFHADCGGHTSAAHSVWGGRDRPYLSAVLDDGPAATAHQSWRYQTSLDDLRRALNGDPRTVVGDRLDTIVVLDRDAGGRAERVALHAAREAIVRGEDLRDVLIRAFGPRSIRSTRFTVRRDGALFTFEGQGFGHGVGLCQAGAFARVRAGETLASVLYRYFPGTRISPVQWQP
jgi:stage II sporulation protein D